MTKWTKMQDKALTAQGNLLISASAGSGKTTVMVQKIADYLFSSNNADISKLVVITFTKAIAEEMKQKLTDKLYEKLRSSMDDGERERIRKQINGIPISNISTIDSFCTEIFRRYFEVINKDPLVSVIEQSEAEYMFALAREEVLEKYLFSDDLEFIQLVEKFTAKRDIDRLRKAIDDIHKFLAVQADADIFIYNALIRLDGKVTESITLEYLLSYYRKKASGLAKLCEDKIRTTVYFAEGAEIFGKFNISLSELLNTLLNIANAASMRNLFAIASSSTTVRAPSVSKKLVLQEEEQAALDDIKSVHSACNDFIKDVQKNFARDFDDVMEAEKESRTAAKKLFEIALNVIKEYQDAKEKEKRIDFADIEHYALQILNNDAVAEEMRSSIDKIFIDEYQDTNYLQESIIARISKGNVFMVGDVKQSIYKFRFAEPAIFLDKRKRYESEEEGININFNENFRSTEEILKFINLVFDEIMIYDLGGIDYRKDARLIYGQEKSIKKQNTLADAEIAWFSKNTAEELEYPEYYSVKGGPRMGKKPSPEAVYVADKIESLAGKAYIYDAKADNYRLCRYSDIAILFRARSCGNEVIDELRRRNIPFVADGFADTGDTASTDTLICFAKLLDNPMQDIPLATVMLSYFGKFTDKEMLDIRSVTPNGYFWEALRAYKGNQIIENKIHDLVKLTEKYRRLSNFMDMRELFDRLISETGYDGYLLSQSDTHIRRLNAFVFSLTDKDSASTLQSFIKLCGAEEQTLPPSAAEDCITITTIHKSKGLEYPIVFLPRIDYDNPSSTMASIIMDDKTGSAIKNRKNIMGANMIALDVKLGIAIMHIDDEKRKTETLSTLALKIKQENERKSELIRLLYVAMTRARQHLFISGKETAKSPLFADETSSFSGWINFAINNNSFLKKYVVRPQPNTVIIEAEKHIYVPTKTSPVDLNKVYPHAESTLLSCKYSVSSLSSRNQEEEAAPSYKLEFGASDNIALGTAYHAILQYADFSRNTPKEVDEQIQRLLDTKKISSLPDNFDRQPLYRAFANPRFIELCSKKCLREQAFMLYVPACEITETQSKDRVLVQGVIDLLSIGEENVIIDYKFTSASMTTVIERYRKQLYIYTMAAQRALNIDIDRREIYLIGRDEFVTV